MNDGKSDAQGKEKLLTLLLEKEGLGTVQPQVIRARDTMATTPLSFAQQRVWFLEQLERESVAYNMSGGWRLEGRLDSEALRKALETVVRRHESLRTVFHERGGQPYQVIQPPGRFEMPRHDLGDLAEEHRASEVARLARQEAKRPFDLTRDLLVRATLLRLSDAEHVLLLTQHHIASDGWSQQMLRRELNTLYEAYRRGEPSPLPELPIQYADYAVWQRNELRDEKLARLLDYWRRQLNGLTPLELPTDRVRPPHASYQGAQHRFRLEPSLVRQLRELSRAESVTLHMTLMGAFQALLARYSRQNDIAVGMPIAGRHHEELENLIGFFINTLVMRTDFSRAPTFRELLSRVRQTSLEAYDHQNLPFEVLVDALQPERHVNRSPLIQVSFQLLSFDHGPPALPGLEVSLLPSHNDTARFDLSMSLFEKTEGIEGRITYRTDLFDADTIKRFTAHFKKLLEGIVTNPDCPVLELPLMREQERRRVTVEWNNTAREPIPDRCVHESFEEHVQRSPERTAVVFGDCELTYEELDRRANQLAHYLIGLGVEPDVMVGICVERSLEMVVAILGILKAGGAWVPIDPNDPPTRIADQLEDTAAIVLLTQSQLSARLSAYGGSILCLDADWPAIARQRNTKPVRAATGESLAYVMYTSGSTGRPKGVMIPHRAIDNFVTYYQREFPLGENDRVLLKTPYTFDPSVWELLAPLCAGATLVVAEPDRHSDPDYLIDTIERHQVTTTRLVTTFLRVLLEHRDFGRCKSLRYLFCGAEVMPAELANQFNALLPGVLYHAYGPTEAAIAVTVHPTRIHELEAKVPIGRPIDNVQAYILDQHKNPVPIGVPGELHIGGVCLARGYLNRPRETAERFIRNPFGTEPDSRLYRTGDLARFLPDGNIEFMGRVDDQLKIRGFRIEPGEIEAALTDHPAVRQSVVVARENQAGRPRLVAYVVADRDEELIDELVAHLAERLPRYMIPASIVLLERMPLLTSGKVDRQALPVPMEPARRSTERPRNRVEAALVQVWQQVLDLEKVGIFENFFAIGGDSILAIQVVSRARDSGVQITPQLMFKYQTIAELAAAAEIAAPAPPVEQGPVTGEVPLTPIQRSFFEQEPVEPCHHNQAMMIELTRPVAPNILKDAWNAILLHHDALRMRYHRDGTNWCQENAAPEDEIAFEVVELGGSVVADKGRLIQSKAGSLQAALDIERGPLVRVAWFDLGTSKPARMLAVIHHLAVDGVSWRILLQDLQTACEQLESGKPLQLPPKTWSFQRWATNLTKIVSAGGLDDDLPFWSEVAKYGHGDVPIDHDRGPNVVGSTDTVRVLLDAVQTKRLLHEVGSAYNTQINDVLLTALGLALGEWTGRASVMIELEGHGREDLDSEADVSRTVGWFTSIFPFRIEIDSSGDAIESLKMVKELVRAVPRNGISFGLLRDVHPNTDRVQPLRKMAVPHVRFNYLGQFDQVVGGLGLFIPASESAGPMRSPRNGRASLLVVNSRVINGQLEMHWSFSRNYHHRATIERVAERFALTLREIIEHCSQPTAGGMTPSDFPLADLDQRELDDLLADLGGDPS